MQSFDGVKGDYLIADCTQTALYLFILQLFHKMSDQSFGLYALADAKLRRNPTSAISQTIIDIPPKESSAGGTI
jgi:hypothetical protein